jgi:hypothetical protein
MRDVPTFPVACIKKLGRTVYVAPGNGDGTFQPQSAVATGFDHPYATAVADLNRDGSLDLAIANTSNVNCAGSSVAPPTSNEAPVSDWFRMRQAIASPLSSMRPAFKPLRPQYSLSALSRFKLRLLIWRPQSRRRHRVRAGRGWVIKRNRVRPTTPLGSRLLAIPKSQLGRACPEGAGFFPGSGARPPTRGKRPPRSASSSGSCQSNTASAKSPGVQPSIAPSQIACSVVMASTRWPLPSLHQTNSLDQSVFPITVFGGSSGLFGEFDSAPVREPRRAAQGEALAGAVDRLGAADPYLYGT